jgi:dihydrofolate reductase
MPRVSLIVAMSRNRVIGRDNALPWHLPADLKRFKELTMGHHIVMGRKTWESIKRLLPGRTSVVITRDRDFKLPGAKIASSLQDALRQCGDDPEVFVIGGAQIFRVALPVAERIYLTTVDAAIEGDTFMPTMDLSHWRKLAAEIHLVSDTNPLPWTFEIYERNRGQGTPA